MLTPLSEVEIRTALLDVQRGITPIRQRDLQAALLISYADERCTTFKLTEEGCVWLVEHGDGTAPKKQRDDMETNNKIAEALNILESCIGTRGVYADPSRYDYQCWTRDFALAIQPVLHHVVGGVSAGERHIDSLVKRQQSSGKMPIVFLDGPLGTAHFLWEKTKKSIRDRKMSFMLRRYLAGQLANLTPGTRDSELLFLLAVAQRGNLPISTDLAIASRKARTFIELNLLTTDDMVMGADWRDTMERELGNQPLLSNNAIWHGLLRHTGFHGRAEQLRQKLRARVENGILVDYPGAGRFDPLGGALAILHGVVDAKDADWMVACFKSVDSAHGVTIRCRHNPQNADEAAVIDRTDGVVVWPFVVGFSAIALHQLGTSASRKLANEQLDKLLALDGFREWYDPANGKGYGAQKQLWSATLTLRACEAILGEKALDRLAPLQP